MGIKQKIKKIIIGLRYAELRTLPVAVREDAVHLGAAIEWLCTAQDATKKGLRDDGVSAAYDLWKGGWQQSYRETTGYIIETFLEYYRLTKDRQYLERAARMGDWEISVQCEDGAVGEIKKDGSVGKKIFNTGQVLLGLLALYKETGSEKYLRAAQKGADWIVNNQDANGSWMRFTNQTNDPKTYQSRVAWPLLALWKITGDIEYRTSAERAIAWILEQQQENYWFNNASFDGAPVTHLIAYTINGLLESHLIFPNGIWLGAARGAAEEILAYYKKHGDPLPATFDRNWRSSDRYTCPTGDAQLAIVWMQLYAITKEQKFLEGAVKILEYVKSVQCMDTKNKNIYGGLPGSYPVDGAYSPYQLPNWAPKFFADALMMKAKIQK